MTSAMVLMDVFHSCFAHLLFTHILRVALYIISTVIGHRSIACILAQFKRIIRLTSESVTDVCLVDWIAVDWKRHLLPISTNRF
jgi:hypothetical protein